MKKIGIIITAVTLSVLICALGAFAAGSNRSINTNDEEGEVQTVLQTSDPSFNETSTTLNFTNCPADGAGVQHSTNNQGSFIDQNEDGVCDNLGSATRPSDGSGNQYGTNNRNQWIDQDADGIYNYSDTAAQPADGTGFQYGANNHNIFVDQDGDGICDQAGSTCCSSNCIGNQYRANCQNQFIDQNNDGVCDRIDAQERGEKLGYQYRNGIKK